MVGPVCQQDADVDRPRMHRGGRMEGREDVGEGGIGSASTCRQRRPIDGQRLAMVSLGIYANKHYGPSFFVCDGEVVLAIRCERILAMRRSSRFRFGAWSKATRAGESEDAEGEAACRRAYLALSNGPERAGDALRI